MIINTHYKGSHIPIKRGTYDEETKTFRRDNAPMMFKTCVMHEEDVIDQLTDLDCKVMYFVGLHFRGKKYDIEVKVDFDEFKRKATIQNFGQLGEQRPQYNFNLGPYLNGNQ